MKIHEKYLETLKTFDDYVIVSEWAEKVGQVYPDILTKANEEAKNQKNDTTDLREIAARISSRLSSGGFDRLVRVDNSERPRRVKYISKEELEVSTNESIEEDLEPLTRREIERKAEDTLALKELYRLDEFRNIQKAFKAFFGLDFEIDHAKALLSKDEKGSHHPNNMHLLLKFHNGKKNNTNWERFTCKEQIAYIKKAIELQFLVSERLSLDIDEGMLNSLLARLEQVY